MNHFIATSLLLLICIVVQDGAAKTVPTEMEQVLDGYEGVPLTRKVRFTEIIPRMAETGAVIVEKSISYYRCLFRSCQLNCRKTKQRGFCVSGSCTCVAAPTPAPEPEPDCSLDGSEACTTPTNV